jgi:hypothetical protein
MANIPVFTMIGFPATTSPKADAYLQVATPKYEMYRLTFDKTNGKCHLKVNGNIEADNISESGEYVLIKQEDADSKREIVTDSHSYGQIISDGGIDKIVEGQAYVKEYNGSSWAVNLYNDYIATGVGMMSSPALKQLQLQAGGANVLLKSETTTEEVTDEVTEEVTEVTTTTTDLNMKANSISLTSSALTWNGSPIGGMTEVKHDTTLTGNGNTSNLGVANGVYVPMVEETANSKREITTSSSSYTQTITGIDVNQRQYNATIEIDGAEINIYAKDINNNTMGVYINNFEHGSTMELQYKDAHILIDTSSITMQVNNGKQLVVTQDSLMWDNKYVVTSPDIPN